MQPAASLLLAFASIVLAGMLAIDVYGLFSGSRQEYKRGYSPKCLVIVPCKGVDLTLEDNLKSLKGQKYRNYLLLAVVDSNDDPALAYIRKLGIRYIVAREVCKGCSGKVNAVLYALSSMRDFEAYAIADSDIYVDSHWLGSLVAPLKDSNIGISTMYPVFNPVGGFWSRVKMLWGLVGEGLLENEGTRFGWGGSLAFRGSLITEKDIEWIKHSGYRVSDDISITKICKRKGYKIAYVKEHRPIVNCKESMSSFVEWANRQTALTLLGYRKNLYYGIAFYSGEIILLVSGIVAGLLVNAIWLGLLLHLAISEAKTQRRIKGQRLFSALLVPVMPFIYLSNLLYASRMRSIVWRGSSYRIA